MAVSDLVPPLHLPLPYTISLIGLKAFLKPCCDAAGVSVPAATGRKLQLSPTGVPPLPYTAPFTASVPAMMSLVRRFVRDSLAYLRGVYSDTELLSAVLHQRDRMLSKVGMQVYTIRLVVASCLSTDL